MRGCIYALMMMVAMLPYRAEAQEIEAQSKPTAATEIAAIRGFVEMENTHFLRENGYCYCSDMMEKCVEYITSNTHAEIPEPENIVDFFSGIPDDAIAYDMWYDGVDDPYRIESLRKFREAVEALQAYNADRTQPFPAEMVLDRVGSLLAAYDDATWEGVLNSAHYRLLAYRLLQQLVRLTPSIDLISTSVSDDGCLALYDSSKASMYNPVLIPIYYKNGGKWRVLMRTECTPRDVKTIYENERYYSRLLDIEI